MTEFEKKFKDKTGQNFNEYYKQYKPKLIWYLTKYTKNLEIAEEFANMAFIQGLEKIDTYKPNLSQFITWLTSIAINLVIKDYKDRKKYNITSIDQEIIENFSLNTILQQTDDSIDKIIEMENKAKCEKIIDVINSLPDKYKKVMKMREIDKKPYKEISEMITKEQEIDIIYDNYHLDINEYFKSIIITNNGNSNASIIINENTINILPKEKKEIYKENISNEIIIKSENTKTNLLIIESTNLSTIKSQIKKGRLLIRKKVKKHFELIDKNGLE